VNKDKWKILPFKISLIKRGWTRSHSWCERWASYICM